MKQFRPIGLIALLFLALAGCQMTALSPDDGPRGFSTVSEP